LIQEQRDENGEWLGGDRVLGSLLDEYIPKNMNVIMEMMGPIEYVAKRACYTKKWAKVARLIATKFITRGQPVQIEYFDRIYASRSWAYELDDRQYRFENHLHGKGLDEIMATPRPEILLWKHLEYMRIHMNDLVDPESTKKWMKFDEESRVRELRPINPKTPNL
jgi:hypothetical protein